jgi:hypothetical protein
MPRDVAYKDFQTFVDEKGLERPCPECGTNDWQILGGGDEGDGKDQPMFLANFPELDDFPRSRLRAFAVYVMYCGHCGVVKPVAAPVVWEWLEAQQNG